MAYANQKSAPTVERRITSLTFHFYNLLFLSRCPKGESIYDTIAKALCSARMQLFEVAHVRVGCGGAGSLQLG